MKENGDVFLNDKKMSLHALEHILKHTISSGNNNEVSIASDKNVSFANIMVLMDIARKSGAESVSFLTDNEQ